MEKIKTILGVITASFVILGVVGGALLTVWGWRPASSSEVQKLNEKQTEIEIELYTQKRRSLILDYGQVRRERKAGADSNFLATQELVLEKELNDAQKRLDKARERKLELGK